MTLTRKLRMIFMLLCMTVASSFCAPCATQAVFAAEIQHNELIDGGITGSIYEQQFDETVALIYELREEGYSFEKINEVLESSNALSEPSSLKSTKGLDPSDKFYDYAHLNSIEKKLYKENKAKALLCLRLKTNTRFRFSKPCVCLLFVHNKKHGKTAWLSGFQPPRSIIRV